MSAHPVILQLGQRYAEILPDGSVRRLDIEHSPSGEWRIVGAVTRDNFGNARRPWSLSEILENPGAIPWRCKNGAQRTFLRDIDHGTPREWANPTHEVIP